MILFYEYGRLGNQIFQYLGLKNYFPKHRLVFFGLNSLKYFFDNLEVDFIDLKKKQMHFIFLLLKKITYFLAAIRIIGRINESTNSKNFELIIRKGLFYNIYVAQDIYFQDNKSIFEIKNQIKIRSKFINIAKNWLREKKIHTKKSKLIFVHVRRGDYLLWPNKKFPAVLDFSWYVSSMSYLKKKVKKPIFILMSDDLHYIHDIFKESKSLIISKNIAEVDLSIMSLCSHGIMSPSSFAWWGSFFIKKSNLYKRPSYFIAPKFWAGHRSKKWFPKKFYFDWIIYK